MGSDPIKSTRWRITGSTLSKVEDIKNPNARFSDQQRNHDMKNFKPPAATRLAIALFGAALLVNSSWPSTVAAQDNTPDPAAPKDAAQSTSADPDLAAQIADLREKVGRLEALLEKSPGSGITSNPSGGMEPTVGKNETKSSMEGMDDAANKMDGTESNKESAGGMGMMGKGMKGDKGMDMMRQGGSEAEMARSHNPQMKKMMLKMKIKKIELEMINELEMIKLELQMMEVK